MSSIGTVKDEFDPAAFRCRDGSQTPQAALERLRVLHGALLVLRDHARSPEGGNLPGAEVQILSGYRSPSYNAKVGGEPNSKHMKGEAADIVILGTVPSMVHQWIATLIKCGKMPQGGLGAYPGFTHYDIRGTRARWSKV